MLQLIGLLWISTWNRVQYRPAEIRHIHLPRLLKWDDRNSMVFSVEGRYPFLVHRFVE
jgi:asparagine synthase (glutamine-hydrolysing)